MYQLTECPSARAVLLSPNCVTDTLYGTGLGISIGYILLSIPSMSLTGVVFIVTRTLEPLVVAALLSVIILVP